MDAPAAGTTGEASVTVTAERVEEFADATGDHNPLHVDAEYAAKGFFGERVAHGMLSAGVISAAITDLPAELVYLGQDLEFVSPVRIGWTLRASATVVERLAEDRLRIETEATADGTVVTTGEARALVVDPDRSTE